MADNHVPGASCQFLKINSPFHLLYLPFIRKGLKINLSKGKGKLQKHSN